MFGAVMRISFFFGKPGMGFLPASCRSATIRRPAAYEAAALPTELRRRNRLGMRGGGWAMRAKEFLPCGRLMPSAASCSRSGTQRFACDHWSHRAFAGIRTRTEQFLRLSPLPVGLRKHARTPLSQCSGGIRVSPRFALKPAVDALYYSLRHDMNHGLTPMLHETVPTTCGSAETRSVVDHAPGNLSRDWAGRLIGFAPIPPTRDCPHHPGDDGRYSMRARRTNGNAHTGHDPHGHDIPPGVPAGVESYRAAYGNRTRIISVEG